MVNRKGIILFKAKFPNSSFIFSDYW